jgi:hypothetical protein
MVLRVTCWWHISYRQPTVAPEALIRTSKPAQFYQ